MSDKKNIDEALVPVSGWETPEGISSQGIVRKGRFGGVGTVDNPSDPDAGDGLSLSGLTPQQMAAYKNEIKAHGGRFQLEQSTRAALKQFESSPAWSQGRYSTRGVRWALRPPMVNAMAGGIPDSYHQDGRALDIKHSGQNESVSLRKEIIRWALISGFRGIGFGSSQTHFDTRSNGLTVYTYSFNTGTALQAVQALIDETGVDVSFSARAIRPADSGIGSRTLMTAPDVEKLVRALNGSGGSFTGGSTQTQPETPSVSPTTPDFKDLSDDVRDAASRNLKNALTGMAIVGILLGGLYGFSSFLKRREERQEAKRLTSERSMRMELMRIRTKHRDLIEAAKTDRRAAEKLQRIINDAINSRNRRY